MAYNFPRKPKNNVSEDSSQQREQWEQWGQTLWDSIKSPFEGLYQGTFGKNLTREQYLKEKAKKQQGKPPGQYPGRGVLNWLGRTMTGRR